MNYACWPEFQVSLHYTATHEIVQENILNMVLRRLAGYCTFYITRASPEGVIEMLLSKYWNVVIKYWYKMNDT